jgi:hypothetical protein
MCFKIWKKITANLNYPEKCSFIIKEEILKTHDKQN